MEIIMAVLKLVQSPYAFASLVLMLVVLWTSPSVVEGRNNVLKVIGKFDQVIDCKIDGNTTVNIEFENTPTSNPYRVWAWSENAQIDFPVLVVVYQQRRVLSWQIPLVVDRDKLIYKYLNTSRTLCFDQPDIIQTVFREVRHTPNKNFSVQLSTFSIGKVDVRIKVSEVKDFFLEDANEISTTVSPSEPAYFSYIFKGNSETGSAFIDITSPDDICLVASVQNRICPVQDLTTEITYAGKYETILKQGGMLITRSLFPNGFFLVFVANVNNRDCGAKFAEPQPRSLLGNVGKRETAVTFRVEPGLKRSDYVRAILIAVFGNVGLCLICIFVTLMFYYFGPYSRSKRSDDMKFEFNGHTNESCTDEVDLSKTKFTVNEFCVDSQKNNRKSRNFLWHITNIFLFYGIPVTQLMISYQMEVNESGNHDMCYHNYLCSHPWYFTDFNHLLSNVGYILFGFMFIGIVIFRDVNVVNQQGKGIPTHYGLFYAMGCALVFEGVLSANYHICPTPENFQFDTSFMYIMAVLVIVKLYQNRHPDINASAYMTFGILGVHIFLAMIGIIIQSKVIMIIFIILDILLCVYVSFKVYFFTTVVKGLKHYYDEITEQKITFLQKVTPYRKVEFFCLSIANIINLSIAIAGVILYPEKIDFGTYLLGILMMNAGLYLIFYITMKLVHKERICVEACLYLVMAVLLWGISAYFFMSVATNSSVSPAESRQYNRKCIFLNFYDTHDIWHLLSAPALFFSFMALLTIDDNLLLRNQNKIVAF